ncbi:MAG: hypothetical protein V1815_01655 [Candidatus Woesearchaeota archaeon]
MLSRRQFIKLGSLSLLSPSILQARDRISDRQELSIILSNFPNFPVVTINDIDYGVGITKDDFYLIFQRDNHIVDNERIIKNAIFTSLIQEKVKSCDTSDLELKLETLKQLSKDSVIEELSDLIDIFKDKESEKEEFIINPYRILKNIFNTLNSTYINPIFQARALILKQSNLVLNDYEKFIQLIKKESLRSQRENELRENEFKYNNTTRKPDIEYINHLVAKEIYELGSKTEPIVEPSINYLKSLKEQPSDFYKEDPKNLKILKSIVHKDPNNIYVKSELQRIGKNLAQQIKSSPEYQQFVKEKREISLKYRNLRNELHDAKFLTSID